MKRLSYLIILSVILLSSCSVFCPQEEWSTVPSTNNPNIIIDDFRGSSAGSPEY